MKRYIGSLLLAMVFALGLLPVTALAADTNTVYVGGVALAGSSDSIVYATTNEKGEVITEGATADNYNIKWDGNTLTLKGAYITKEVSTPGLSSPVEGAAIGVYNQSGDANLTITLEGTNTIKDVSAAIHVFAPSGSASLTITGDGILSASSGYNPGIRVQSNTGNGTLAITGAKVTASASYSGNGVQIRCGDSSNASLTVDGGSLTATGSGATFAGIIMQFGSSTSGSGTPTVTVSDNAIVRANGSAGGITSNSSAEVHTAAGTGESGGIVFDNGTGTVYGDVELQEDLTIGKGESLKLNDGASLNAGNHNVIVDGGTLDERLATSLGDSVKYAPTITTQPTGQSVTEGETATFTITATGTEKLSYQWQQSTDKGKSWTNIDGATSATYTTGATTTSMNGTQYRCVVSNSAGKVTSDVVTLTVNKHVHTWGDPVWSWSEDGKTCTVTFICQNDETHKETPAVTVTSAVKTPATCTEKGVTAYTATVEFDGKTHTDTKDVTDIPATGHSWGEPVWSWSADGKSCTVTFTCKNNETHKESPTVKITSAVKTPATCQAKGVTTYTATAELDGKTYTSTKDVTDIPLADHVAKWEGDYPATCDRNGREGTATCTVCGKVLVEDKVIPAPGHKYGEPVWTWSKDGKSCTVTFTCSVCGYASENKATVTTKTSTEATCTQPGTATQQAQVVFNGNTYTTTKGNVTLAALGHNYKDGKCTRCGQADPNAKPAATASVTTGANGKWQTDSTQGLSFNYAGDGKFLRVQVNGTTLKEDQYQQQGNTVTLTQEYLKTLDPGSYTLVIALENSSAKTTFTVEQPAQATPVPTPQPTQQPEEQEDSEKSGNLLWIALGGGAAVLLIGGVAFLRFKRSLYD